MIEYYKPSGRFSPLSPVCVLVAAIAMLGVAFVYQWLIRFIPLIYLNFLLTCGVGILLAVAGGMAIRMGHIRNVPLAFLVGFVLLLVTLGGKYWFQYRHMVSEVAVAVMEENGVPSEKQQELVAALTEKLTFTEHIKLRVEEGWTIGRGGGAPVGGPMVYFVWLLEAAIIFFTGVMTCGNAGGAPYNERLGKWADEEEVVMTLPIESEEKLAKITGVTDISSLLEIPVPSTLDSDRNAVYKTHSIEGKEVEDAYLSVDLVTHSVNNKGEEQEDVLPLIKYAVISSEQRAELLERAKLIQEGVAAHQEANQETTESEGE